jgi:hypothetical protein
MTESLSEHEKRERALRYALEYLRHSSGYGPDDGTYIGQLSDNFFEILYGKSTTGRRTFTPPQPPIYFTYNVPEGLTTEQLQAETQARTPEKTKTQNSFKEFYNTLSQSSQFFLDSKGAWERYIQWTGEQGIVPLVHGNFITLWNQTKP